MKTLRAEPARAGALDGDRARCARFGTWTQEISERKLFAVYLGGRIAKCNTELHDVVFVAGTHIEATYEQAMDKWFGDLPRLHLDSWVELRIVDGHRNELRPEPPTGSQKLF